MTDLLRSLSYPSLDAVALGSAVPVGLEALGFSADGDLLLVKVSFIDSGAIAVSGAQSMRSAVFVFDASAQSYLADLNSLIGAEPAISSAPISLLDAQFAGNRDRVFVHYTVPSTDATPAIAPRSRVAIVDLEGAQTGVTQADLIAAVLGHPSVDLHIEAMQVSDDGRFVAVQTASPLLLDDVLDNNDRSDVYLIDTQTLAVRRVSEINGIGPPQNSASELRDIHLAGDGSVQVLFASDARFSNLDLNDVQDLYLWQAGTTSVGTLTLVSRQGGRAFGGEAGFIANGQVLFERWVGDEVQLYRTLLGQTSDALVVDQLDDYFSANFQLDGLASDGSLILFSSDRGPGLDLNSPVQAFIFGPSTGLSALLSTAGGGPADDAVVSPRLSADGSAMAFVSQAGNLGGDLDQTSTGMLYLGSTRAYGVVQNLAPSGAVTISGTPEQGQTLTASNTLTDPDGLGTIRYQWKAGGVNIEGATNASFALTQAQVGRTISVVASYTDQKGSAETVASAATAPVANVNDSPTWNAVSVLGIGRIGERLMVDISGLSDADGMGPVSIQWLRGGAAIAGATGQHYELTSADAGRAIAVSLKFNDSFDTLESFQTPAISVPNPQLAGTTSHWKNDVSLSEVSLRLSGSSGALTEIISSNLAGEYLFDDLQPGEYLMTPSYPTHANALSAITSADAMAALKLALGRNPNPDPDGPGPLQAAPISAYQWIAADINADGRVDRADATEILRIAQGQAASTALAQWVFVDALADLSSIGAADAGLPDLGPVVAETALVGLNLVGILRGDVDGSWAPLNV